MAALNHNTGNPPLQTCHRKPPLPPPLKVVRQIEWLLGVCACHSAQPWFPLEVQEFCRSFSQWDSLVALAEYHGMGPVLHTGMTSASHLVPTDIRWALKGLFLRHQHASAVRMRVLAEILQAFALAAIDTLVLKGAALAWLVYPSPGLRPMRDVDLLVPEADANRAQRILSSCGFDISPDASHILTAQHHHLEVARRSEEGLTVSVEVHHRLYPKSIYYPTTGFADLYPSSISFQVESVRARTLGLEDMLGHVVRHAVGPPLLGAPLRFIHLSDLTRLVDTFGTRIDWPKLARKYPRVPRILALLNASNPDQERSLGGRPHSTSKGWQGMFQDYHGWPRERVAGLVGGRIALKETFSPGEWWIRLFYGAGTHSSWLLHRWVRHPMHLMEWFVASKLKKYPMPQNKE